MKTTTQEMAERIEAEEIIEWVDGFNNLKAAMERLEAEYVDVADGWGHESDSAKAAFESLRKARIELMHLESQQRNAR